MDVRSLLSRLVSRDNRGVLLVSVLAGIVLFGGLLVAASVTGRPGSDALGSGQGAAASPADYGPAPAYVLTDQTGQRISSRHFAGTVQVVSFLFPYCTTDCPLLARTLAILQQRLAEQGLGGRVEIVTFNVDPSGAGPAQLRRFIAQYGGQADPGAATVHWHFLTGSAKDLRNVVRGGYHIAYWKVAGAEEGGTTRANRLAEEAQVDYDVRHTDATYLVSGRGAIVDVRQGRSAADTSALLTVLHQVLG
jgi:cytochrome oxidase Cu insertion factor (SCO1/SenC/PrrC family)